MTKLDINGDVKYLEETCKNDVFLRKESIDEEYGKLNQN